MFNQVKEVLGTKITITATGILDEFPFVFSNYNIEGVYDIECG